MRAHLRATFADSKLGVFLNQRANNFASDYPFTAAKLRYYTYRLTKGPAPRPFDIYVVDPNAIDRYVEWTQFGTFPYAGRIVSGTWDRDAEPLTSLAKYSLIRQHFAGEISAQELTSEDLIDHGYPAVEAVPYDNYGYGKYLDILFRSLDDNGVLLQETLTAEKRSRSRYDYVAVNIGRDGELLFDENGCHRFTIAQELDVSIPVRIDAIHREWYEEHGHPKSHAELNYAGYVPIPWTNLPALDRRTAEILHGPRIERHASESSRRNVTAPESSP